MNYEARIAAMREKGILDEREAETLQTSLRRAGAERSSRRRYTLEGIGLLLFTLLAAYLAMQAGLSTESGGVEDVRRTLNDPRTGLGAAQSFWLLLAGCLTAAYLGLYLWVHRLRNALWRLQEGMNALGILIAELEIRQSDLREKLQSFIPGKCPGAKAAMEITAELDWELGQLQREYTALRAECRRKRGKFPYTLAALAGGLPACE